MSNQQPTPYGKPIPISALWAIALGMLVLYVAAGVGFLYLFATWIPPTTWMPPTP